ncbi:MAG: response regulator [Granulosicoccus sp.]
MTIPVVVVDDNETDRYLVMRRLRKDPVFGEVAEVESGDQFLERYFNDQQADTVRDNPLVVLMDVNMPGRNGFETVEEVQQRVAEGQGPKGMVVMMFTSSNNPKDLELVQSYELIKGYILKPMDDESLARIRQWVSELD